MTNPSRRRLIRIPIGAIPPEQLPARIVRSFSLLTAILWLAFGVVHLHMDILGNLAPPGLEMEQEELTWPKPASMFNPAFLHCNSSHLIAANRYATYASQRQKSSKPWADFVKLGQASPAAMLCSSQGCDTYFAREKEMGPWFAASFSGTQAEDVPLPSSWRGPISVSPLACEAQACQAWVAGWDGSGVVVGRLQRLALTNSSTAIPQWSFEPHLDVSPGLGMCESSSIWGSRRCLTVAARNYSSVQGLHIGADGKLLLVLNKGGLLDAWDLQEGRFNGQWQLQGASSPDYTFMCHDGKFGLLLVAKSGLEFAGASLFSVQLPRTLSEDHATVDCGSVSEPANETKSIVV